MLSHSQPAELDMTYDAFFESVIAPAEADARPGPDVVAPYRYQRQLADEPWPDMLDIPTGLGKTAAVTGAWLYRRLIGSNDAPRRLLWCLPMRVLVEQTRDRVTSWLERAAPLFEQRQLVPPRTYVLMGGEAEDDWVRRPEDPAVLIGTQDMLLSRALMRGYGTNRYRWPIDFALLHNDALWVFDEVQLMGVGLATSAQLEGFRRSRDMPPAAPARTLWSSATLHPEWLDTVDFRPHLAGCRVLRLPDGDRGDPRVAKRLAAGKRLSQSSARLASSRKQDVADYVARLCDDIANAHAADGPTLVILNRVARAQEVYRRLRVSVDAAGGATSLLLVHGRFRATERTRLNARLRDLRADDDSIIVATQAVEAGIDLTSRRLFTELAPWPSLVQRFGRCNRGGEYSDAVVHWTDIDTAADAQLALPYTRGVLEAAREVLLTLDSASGADLPPVREQTQRSHVLRRKDLLDLFNTEPDLSGFDIDVSPYLRDPGGADVQLFWRAFDGRPDEQPRPERAELCSVPIGTARDHLKALKHRPWTWNTLESRWDVVDLEDMRPGQVLLLRSDQGGYDAELGFVARLRGSVEPVSLTVTGPDPASMEGDPATAGDYLELSAHLIEARRHAQALARELSMAGVEREVVRAALWHDTGKSHPAFQTAILEHASDDVDRSRFWAKSPDARHRLAYGVQSNGKLQPRRYFRHELASMLAWLEAGLAGHVQVDDDGIEGHDAVDSDLVAYLIAAHHGKVRLALRALPNESRPPDDRLYARGVWSGDTLPALEVNGLHLPELTLRLDLMQVGDGEMGPSWSARTAGLLERFGPFRLAWLETMVRLADWRASGNEP